MNLDECLAAIARGDLSALENVYRNMRVPVYATILAVVRKRELAEDVLQETFVRLYDKASSYTPGTRPTAWILSIARNLAIDALRRRQRDGVSGAPLPELPDHEHLNLLRLTLTDALLRLDQTERQIVVLHDIGDLTHEEIARTLDVPAGTIRWKYRRALRKLKTMLEGERHA